MYRKHCSLINFFVRALASVVVVVSPIAMINSAGANIESALTIAGEEVVKELEWGNVVFHSKDLMNFKETNNVAVVLSHSVPIKNLIRQLQMAVEKEFPRATVTNRIEVRLSGKGFKIKPIVPEILLRMILICMLQWPEIAIFSQFYRASPSRSNQLTVS